MVPAWRGPPVRSRAGGLCFSRNSFFAVVFKPEMRHLAAMISRFHPALLLGALLAAAPARGVEAEAAAQTGDPFQVIIERNPFGLLPPPAPPPPPKEEPKEEPPLDVKLSGIMSIFKPPRAMFVNTPPGAKTPEYLSVAEGEREGGIEVLVGGIDIAKGTVRVNVGGVTRTLSFEEHGVKGAAVSGVPPGGRPVPVPRPAFPSPLGGRVPTPAAAHPGQGIPRPPATLNFQRPVRGAATVPQPTAPTSSFSFPGANAGGGARITIDTRVPQTSVQPPPAPEVDPVVQTILIEANRIQTRQQVQAGDLPPLPSTDITPAAP